MAGPARRGDRRVVRARPADRRSARARAGDGPAGARALQDDRLPPCGRDRRGQDRDPRARGRERLRRHAHGGPGGPLHRRRPPRVRRHRLPAHGRRGHPQRRAAHGRRALDVARRRHRRHPRRRERRPRLGVEGRHDGRRLVPQPSRRRGPVPERDRGQRGPDAPRDGGHRRHLGAQRRVVQLHRGAARQGPRPRHARREHLRRAGRLRRRRRPPDRVVLELRRRPPLLHRARPQRLGLAGAALPLAHPRRDPVGRRRRRRRLRRGARGPPDRRRLRQGDARRQHGEPDGDRDRARSQGLRRGARRPGQGVQPGHAVGPDDRHDLRPPRQRERPARHRARPGLRDQQAPLPLLQPGLAGDPADLPLHARRQRDHRPQHGEADPRVPAPADHLLPLRRLDDVRPDGRPLHLHRRRHAARRVAGLQPDRRPAADQRAGRPGRGRQPRL